MGKRYKPGLPVLLRGAAISILLLFAGSCSEGPRKRPYGYIKIGSLADLQGLETRRPDLRLIVRRDDRGYSVMSTESTTDLAPLAAEMREGREILVSKFDPSSFAMDGTVITGPATFNLPYFKLELAQGKYGGPYDTLYVRIGEEVSKEWRLELKAAPAANG